MPLSMVAPRCSAVAASLVVLVTLAGCGRTTGSPSDAETASFPELRGPYLGQRPPGPDPEVFAPGIVSTGLDTRDVAITPDGRELYFSVTIAGTTAIMVTRQLDGTWTEPAVAPFSDQGMNIEPCIAPDGGTFMFLSTRPPAGEEAKPGWGHQNIWAMDRRGGGWSAPYDLGPPINTDAGEFFPSLTRDGTLYFTRDESPRKSAIYRARKIGGRYQAPERLPAQVNCGESQFNAYVAADESYLIVPVTGRADSRGEVSYYVVFRGPDDTWGDPIEMGERINRPGARGWSASVSPDGRYLFFMSSTPRESVAGALPGSSLRDLLRLATRHGNGSADIYWVDAAVIEALRPR